MNRRLAKKILWLLPLAFCAQACFADAFAKKLVEAAREQTKQQVVYDGSYVSITYPMGDVPADRGVCTDVIIRAYRQQGIDLQQLVHEDMKQRFSTYPNHWGLTRPDPNIDHRRVPNLQTFFKSHGSEVTISENAADYKPGDIVTWMLPGNLPHIGLVSDKYSQDNARPLIIHNIGAGPKEEDALFDYRITGHYRFVGAGID